MSDSEVPSLTDPWKASEVCEDFMCRALRLRKLKYVLVDRVYIHYGCGDDCGITGMVSMAGKEALDIQYLF